MTMNPPLVLVAEDDPDVRCLVATALRHDGYTVIEARDGADMMDHIGSALLFGKLRGGLDPVSLVISDIHMPGHDGLEILAELREAEIGVAVILMTAYDDNVSRGRAKQLGVDGFLRKPFEIDHLRRVVREILTTPDTLRTGASPG